MKQFIARLKRRQVFNVAGIYAVSAWPLIQIADLAVPALGLPDSVLTLLLKIFIAGFPVSLLFAWLFNFTSKGIVRATPETDELHQPQANRQTVVAVSGSLTLILLMTLGSQLAVDHPTAIQPQLGANQPQQSNIMPVMAEDGKESIAILPFVPFSNDPQDEFFADGMVEELLNLLAKIPDLKVAARTSSFAYKGINDKSITQIGRELGVKTILEGSIRKNDITNKIRVTAQLIKVDSGEHLWSETYDREYRDIFQIQDEIARSVVQKMQVTLLGSSDEPQSEFEPQTTSVDAMVAFGKGQKEMGHRTALSLNAALTHFQEAVRLDSHYARAYAAMADVYNLLRIYGHLEAKEARKLANNAVESALLLDDTLAEAHAAKGLMLREVDEKASEAALKKAIELNPNYAPAYMWYGTLLRQRGDLQGSHQYKQKAFELDPKSPVASYLLAMSHYMLGDESKALEMFSHIIANDPYYPDAYNLVGEILFRRGRLDESVQMYKRALDVDELNVGAVKGLLVSYSDLGIYDVTEQWFEYAQRHDDLFHPTQYNSLKFRYYLSRGEREKALPYLDKVREVDNEGPGMTDLLHGSKAYILENYALAVEHFEKLRKAQNARPDWFYQLDKGRTAANLAFAYRQMEMTGKFNELVNDLEQYLTNTKTARVNDADFYYTMAMLKAMQNQATEAFHYLQGAIDVGWVQTWQAENEPVFAQLRNDIQFTLMIGSVKNRIATMREQMIEDEAFMLAGEEI